MVRRLAVSCVMAALLTPRLEVFALEPAAELVTAEGFTGPVFSNISADGSALVAGVPFARRPNGFVAEGAVYVFRNAGRVWSQEAKLFASLPVEEEQMGWSVAIQGDVLVAGAPHTTTFTEHFGRAYVFQYQAGAWNQDAIFVPSISYDGDGFGTSAALDGDRLVVGAPGFGFQPGRAFVFRWDGSQWNEEGVLMASDPGSEDLFGDRLAIDGDRVIVGVYEHDLPFVDAGAAYVFRFDGSSWAQEAKLSAGDAGSADFFGHSVALRGDVAVIGAPGQGPSGTSFGAVYAFRRTPTGWAEEAKILPSVPQNDSIFGTPLTFDGAVLTVGSPNADDAGLFPGQGAAYIFDFDGLNWIEREKITRPRYSMEFGGLTAASGSWIFFSSQSQSPTSIPSSIFAYCLAQDAPCIPTLSGWGSTSLILLVIIASTILLRPQRTLVGTTFFVVLTTFSSGDDTRLRYPQHPEPLLVRCKTGVDESCKDARHAETGRAETEPDLTSVRVHEVLGKQVPVVEGDRGDKGTARAGAGGLWRCNLPDFKPGGVQRTTSQRASQHLDGFDRSS